MNPEYPAILAIDRLKQFATLYPDLVRGATRATFRPEHVEIIWSKYLHTIEELQTVAKRYSHLDWTMCRGNGLDIDWLCDFGDVVVRLECADVVKLNYGSHKVDFSKVPEPKDVAANMLAELRRNEPDLMNEIC